MEFIEELDKIELIASGYEWICPDCDTHNQEIEACETVICVHCGKEFEVTEIYHAGRFDVF